MINFGLMAEKVFDETQFNGVTAIILGSGLGKFADILNEKNIISYNDIPDYPKSTIEGHDGELVTGYFQDQEIIVGKGRFHFYEGYSFQEVVIPIHLFHELGVKNIIITNSSGSMNINFVPGSFMVVKSHMDCTYRYDSKDPKLFSGDPYHCSEMIDLAIKSDKDNIIAPKSAAPGIKNLCLGPIKSLTKCGVTNPTKPIIPQNETEIPTIIEVIKMIFFFRVSTSKPK